MYPLHIRRAVLRMFSDGVKQTEIVRMHGVHFNTFRKWADEAAIFKGQKITDEELDAKIEKWGHQYRTRELAAGASKIRKQRKDDAKFGRTTEHKEKSLASFEQLGDPKQYQEALGEHFTRMTDELGRAQSIEDQMTALSAGILMAQMKTLIDNPPPILTWADGERVIKLLRTTLGMDEKKGGGSDDRVDLRVVSAKPVGKKGKIVEAE